MSGRARAQDPNSLSELRQPVTRTRSCLTFILALVALSWTGVASAAWHTLGGNAGAEPTVHVLSSTPERSVIEISLPGFDVTDESIGGRVVQHIALPGAGSLLEAGAPDLPHVCRSLLVADQGLMRARVIDAEWTELSGFDVAPSKGNLLRTVDPASVPYEFGPVYREQGWYPREEVRAGDPYILRDYRGVTVEALPFRFEPSTGTLKVARRMVIELRSEGRDHVNILDRPAFPASIAVEFADIYRNHFVNWSAFTGLQAGRYNPTPERGSLLVITYDAFRDAMLPLVEWKNQEGIPTRIVNVSTIGTTAAAIDAYITNAYNNEHQAFVLLVGDHAQIPSLTSGGGASDPGYATITGSDNYPELIVGRFSAETVAHVQTQVLRTVTYEREPMALAEWYHKGTGIASNQGPGDDGEYDNQHMDIIRGKLLDYTYSHVDQIYDPTGTAAMVTNALNEGRSIINYTGHGSSTSWGSTGFSNSHVNALQNDWMLPFIISVACVNGDFPSSTCFAEAWLRASRNGNPTGAIGTYMSTINQSWNPPMCGQDECDDLLVNDEMRTFGGLCYNGSCQMMDEYGGGGADMFLTWHIFGDPSLMVRTDTPAPMMVNHAGAMFPGMTDYPVTVTGVVGATCALYGNGVLYGSAITGLGGNALIHLADPPEEPMALTLTVTAYNKMTVIDPVQVLPPEGPYLVLEAVEIDDAGDQQGDLDAGEGAGLHVTMENIGVEPASGVQGTLTTLDPLVQILEPTREFGDIPAGGQQANAEPFLIQVSPNAPDQHAVSFTLQTVGIEGEWDCAFQAVVAAPVLGFASALLDDAAGGNSDGGVDPGETLGMMVTVANTGHAPVGDLTATLASTNPWVIVTDADGSCLLIPDGDTGLVSGLQFQVQPDCPDPSEIAFTLTLERSDGYASAIEFQLPVGPWVDQAESDKGWTCGWSGDTATSGLWLRADPVGTTYNGQQAQPEDDHTTAPGVACFVTGNGSPGGAAGDQDVDGGRTTLVSPIFALDGAASATLTYWRWYTNNLGNNPGADYWSVDVTGDGANWVHLEYTTDSSNSWTQYTFNLEEFVPMTDNVRVRFVADDQAPGTLVEAAVDDITLSVIKPPVAGLSVEDVRAQNGLMLRSPNPLRPGANVMFRTGSATSARLELFDASGRLVRRLLHGRVEAGDHSVSLTGGSLSSGIYFLRLETDQVMEVRQVVIMK